MINAIDVAEKMSNFVEKYAEVTAQKEAGGPEQLSYYESLDENYDLVILEAPIVGTIVAITDNVWTPIFYYLEDDEWTLGDLIGGYLDLYYKR